MFDRGALVRACRAALSEADPLASLASVVAAAMRAPGALAGELPRRPSLEITLLESAEDLTVAVLVTPPAFAFPPHDHLMPSVVGVLAGVEDNVYYRRDGATLVELGRRSVREGEIAAHDAGVVHAIASGEGRPLAALHVYAGNFLRRERSEWRGDPPVERPYDLAALQRLAGRAAAGR